MIFITRGTISGVIIMNVQTRINIMISASSDFSGIFIDSTLVFIDMVLYLMNKHAGKNMTTISNMSGKGCVTLLIF